MKENNAGSLVQQAAVLAAASLVVRFIGFLYRIPLTRLIGDDGNAYYAAGFNYYTFALILSSGALPVAISKLVAERLALKQYRNAHELFRVAMYAAFVTGTAGSLFLALGAGWLARISGYPEAIYAIRTLSPTILIVSVMAVYRGYFQGMRNVRPTALSQVVEQVFNAGFSIWLAYLFFDATRIELAAAGGTAGTGIGALAGLFIIMLIYYWAKPRIKLRVAEDYGKDRFESRKKLLKLLARTAIPIIIGTSIFSIANLIDMTMINGRLLAAGFSYEETKAMYGQFTGKYVLLTTLPVSLSVALATAVVPNLAMSQAVNDRYLVNKKINMALRLSMIISIPAAVGMGVLAQPILTLLFPGHPQGARLLQYGVVSILFLALVQTVTGILQGLGRVDAPMIGAFFGMLVKIPLNYLLIASPRINVIGAVISTCACYILASGIDLFFLYRCTKIKPDISGAFLKPLAASVIMGLAAYVSYYLLMEIAGINAMAVLGAIVIGMGMYVIYMVLIKGFEREDLERLPLGKMRKWLQAQN